MATTCSNSLNEWAWTPVNSSDWWILLPDTMQPPDTMDEIAMPYVQINRNARLKKVIIDRGVNIPEGLVVGESPEDDARRFRRSEGGVCLITQTMIDQLKADR